ncbi:N-acetyltransferase family protein [Ferrimonas gelatinilytica]|uniref:GNAT family N-acetyltransferase n=1 Tax=Ferrimonas gelatinilytica TaxID=1255257 RepID=A0ABP9S7E7_9GAMM
MTIQIRPFQHGDIAPVLAIYNHAILNHSATFEEQPLAAETMAQRLTTIGTEFPVLVAVSAEEVVGYAYGNHYKPRSAYRFCAEISVYLAESAQGQGIGQKLTSALLEALKAQGITQVLAVITSPNPVSEGMHRKLGFRPCGLLKSVGYKFERWHDVGLWQKSL